MNRRDESTATFKMPAVPSRYLDLTSIKKDQLIGSLETAKKFLPVDRINGLLDEWINSLKVETFDSLSAIQEPQFTSSEYGLTQLSTRRHGILVQDECRVGNRGYREGSPSGSVRSELYPVGLRRRQASSLAHPYYMNAARSIQNDHHCVRKPSVYESMALANEVSSRHRRVDDLIPDIQNVDNLHQHESCRNSCSKHTITANDLSVPRRLYETNGNRRANHIESRRTTVEQLVTSRRLNSDRLEAKLENRQIPKSREFNKASARADVVMRNAEVDNNKSIISGRFELRATQRRIERLASVSPAFVESRQKVVDLADRDRKKATATVADKSRKKNEKYEHTMETSEQNEEFEDDDSNSGLFFPTLEQMNTRPIDQPQASKPSSSRCATQNQETNNHQSETTAVTASSLSSTNDAKANKQPAEKKSVVALDTTSEDDSLLAIFGFKKPKKQDNEAAEERAASDGKAVAAKRSNSSEKTTCVNTKNSATQSVEKAMSVKRADKVRTRSTRQRNVPNDSKVTSIRKSAESTRADSCQPVGRSRKRPSLVVSKTSLHLEVHRKNHSASKKISNVQKFSKQKSNMKNVSNDCSRIRNVAIKQDRVMQNQAKKRNSPQNQVIKTKKSDQVISHKRAKGASAAKRKSPSKNAQPKKKSKQQEASILSNSQGFRSEYDDGLFGEVSSIGDISLLQGASTYTGVTTTSLKSISRKGGDELMNILSPMNGQPRAYVSGFSASSTPLSKSNTKKALSKRVKKPNLFAEVKGDIKRQLKSQKVKSKKIIALSATASFAANDRNAESEESLSDSNCSEFSNMSG